MKTKSSFVIAIALTAFSACKKNDCFPTLPGAGGCRIEQLIHPSGDFKTGIDSATFAYNLLGNPVSVQRTNKGTGQPNYLFRYDNQNRLSDFIGVYSKVDQFDGEGFEFWHRFKYDSKNRIAVDSQYYSAASNPYALTPQQYIRFSYDSKDRIIKTVYTYPLSADSTVADFYYGSTGNLDSVKSSPFINVFSNYDNKVNLYSTNKIWQYISKNYSVNNSFQATKYNATGLPLEATITDDYVGRILGDSYTKIVVKYSCK